ncbi:MAG: hypothetical protein JW726_04790 [Anaerolineales bacterium]|nr:hypothetical protein [Anaerolineales bacterium]
MRASRRSWRLLLALALIALSGLACGGGSGDVEATPTGAPPPVGEPTQISPPDEFPTEAPEALPTPTREAIATSTPGSPVAAIPEKRRLTLEWPPTIRAGDSDVVVLMLEMDEDGSLTPTAMIEGHETYGEAVTIPNLYETHQVMAEARLDIAGLTISPGEVIAQALLPGETVRFFWSVKAAEVGDYRGTVWLKLRFIPLDGGPEQERMLTAQLIEIKSVNLLGLGGTPARILGGAGALAGGLIGADDVVKWAWGRWKKRKGAVAKS